jgi:hypothetical protein
MQRDVRRHSNAVDRSWEIGTVLGSSGRRHRSFMGGTDRCPS